MATLSFDYSGKKVWLDDLKAGVDPATYDLCAVHAERFGPPARWEFKNRLTQKPAPAQPSESEGPHGVERLHPPVEGAPAHDQGPASKQAGGKH